MNLKRLTDSELLKSTDRAVKIERDALYDVLLHFQEIQRRRLFSTLGCSSLADYAIKHQKYSADEAQRRIDALQVLTATPNIAPKIESGELNLTHLGMAKAVFTHARKQKKPYSPQQKADLFNKISGTTKREAQKLVATEMPSLPKRDLIRYVSDDRIQIQFEAKPAFEEKLTRVRGKLAHKLPAATLEELFDHLLEKELNQPQHLKPKTDSHAQIIREVRADGRCENCGSHYAPQTDHITPQGYGGSSRRENLRPLCRNCNQRAAIEKYGQNKMDPYINRHEHGQHKPGISKINKFCFYKRN